MRGRRKGMYEGPGKLTLWASSFFLVLANIFRQMKSGHSECEEQPKGVKDASLGGRKERKEKRSVKN